MTQASRTHRPGEVRDAIVDVLSVRSAGASVAEIEAEVRDRLGKVPASSIRSYLRLNTPKLFERTERAHYLLRERAGDLYNHELAPAPHSEAPFEFGRAKLVLGNCLDWMREQQPRSFQAIVTDPPYGLFEYSDAQQEKMRSRKGGIWRIPPSFDGAKRSPLPRFTILSARDVRALEEFFYSWARIAFPILAPGANVVVASNPLLSYVVSSALARAGLERRGEIVRLVMTMRGGDRPKAAHEEFPGVSVMPRSMWEPWLIFRKPLEGRVQDNLRKFSTGGFRRPTKERPFGDVILSSTTPKRERRLAPHPSLKPQSFVRQVVRGVLPLGIGTVLDPFAGAGSTLAAAEAVGYESVGIERDTGYFKVGCKAIPRLAELEV